VLTGARAATERRHDDGKEQRWLELGERAEEGERELGSEGKGAGALLVVLALL
jgi:hypothetical protein